MTAWPIKCANECLIISRPSLSFAVIITKFESSNIGNVASIKTLFIFPAIVAFANPGPILLATSRVVTGLSKNFFEPSGRVISGISFLFEET